MINLPGFYEENVDVGHNTSEPNTVGSDILIKWNPLSLANFKIGVNIGEIAELNNSMNMLWKMDTIQPSNIDTVTENISSMLIEM